MAFHTVFFILAAVVVILAILIKKNKEFLKKEFKYHNNFLPKFYIFEKKVFKYSFYSNILSVFSLKVSNFFSNWILSTNHRRIAIMYFLFTIISGFTGLVLATVIRIELAYPGQSILVNNAEKYLTIISLHGIIMVFFMIIPIIFGAFGNFLLPTQLGIRDVAFPRLNSFMFWVTPSGFVMLLHIILFDKSYNLTYWINYSELKFQLRRRYFLSKEQFFNYTQHTDDSLLALRFKKLNNTHVVQDYLLYNDVANSYSTVVDKFSFKSSAMSFFYSVAFELNSQLHLLNFSLIALPYLLNVSFIKVFDVLENIYYHYVVYCAISFNLSLFNFASIANQVAVDCFLSNCVSFKIFEIKSRSSVILYNNFILFCVSGNHPQVLLYYLFNLNVELLLVIINNCCARAFNQFYLLNIFYKNLLENLLLSDAIKIVKVDVLKFRISLNTESLSVFDLTRLCHLKLIIFVNEFSYSCDKCADVGFFFLSEVAVYLHLITFTFFNTIVGHIIFVDLSLTSLLCNFNILISNLPKLLEFSILRLSTSCLLELKASFYQNSFLIYYFLLSNPQESNFFYYISFNKFIITCRLKRAIDISFSNNFNLRLKLLIIKADATLFDLVFYRSALNVDLVERIKLWYRDLTFLCFSGEVLFVMYESFVNLNVFISKTTSKSLSLYFTITCFFNEFVSYLNFERFCYVIFNFFKNNVAEAIFFINNLPYCCNSLQLTLDLCFYDKFIKSCDYLFLLLNYINFQVNEATLLLNQNLELLGLLGQLDFNIFNKHGAHYVKKNNFSFFNNFVGCGDDSIDATYFNNTTFNISWLNDKFVHNFFFYNVEINHNNVNEGEVSFLYNNLYLLNNQYNQYFTNFIKITNAGVSHNLFSLSNTCDVNLPQSSIFIKFYIDGFDCFYYLARCLSNSNGVLIFFYKLHYLVYCQYNLIVDLMSLKFIAFGNLVLFSLNISVVSEFFIFFNLVCTWFNNSLGQDVIILFQSVILNIHDISYYLDFEVLVVNLYYKLVIFKLFAYNSMHGIYVRVDGINDLCDECFNFLDLKILSLLNFLFVELCSSFYSLYICLQLLLNAANPFNFNNVNDDLMQSDMFIDMCLLSFRHYLYFRESIFNLIFFDDLKTIITPISSQTDKMLLMFNAASLPILFNRLPIGYALLDFVSFFNSRFYADTGPATFSHFFEDSCLSFVHNYCCSREYLLNLNNSNDLESMLCVNVINSASKLIRDVFLILNHTNSYLEEFNNFNSVNVSCVIALKTQSHTVWEDIILNPNIQQNYLYARDCSLILNCTSSLQNLFINKSWHFTNRVSVFNENFINSLLFNTVTYKYEVVKDQLNNGVVDEFFYNNLLSKNFCLVQNNLQKPYIISLTNLQLFSNFYAKLLLNMDYFLDWKELRLEREVWRSIDDLSLARRHWLLRKKYYANFYEPETLINKVSIWFPNHLIPGWAFVTPYSSRLRYTALGKVDIALIVIFMASVGSTFSSVNYVITYRYIGSPIFKNRKELRSFFVDALLVSSRMMILANPALIIGIILLLSDRHFGTSVFDFSGGGDTILFQHLFWFFGHPEVYIIIIPCFGFMNSLLPYYLKKRLSGRLSLQFSMYTIAFMGFAVWGHHLYMVGLANSVRTLYSTMTVMISVPASTKVLHWCVTIINSTISCDVGFLFLLSFMYFFVLGGLSGMFLAHIGFDVIFHDTFYVIGHFHVMLAGAAMSCVFAAFYFYFPAIFGVKYSRAYAYLHFFFYTGGQILTLVPMFWLGYAGMPRRIMDYPSIFGGWHSIISSGHILTFLSLVFFLLMIFDSLYESRSPISKTKGVSRLNNRLSLYVYEIRKLKFYKNKIMSNKNSYISNNKLQRKNLARLELLNFEYMFKM